MENCDAGLFIGSTPGAGGSSGCPGRELHSILRPVYCEAEKEHFRQVKSGQLKRSSQVKSSQVD